jgi:hypothetical protein
MEWDTFCEHVSWCRNAYLGNLWADRVNGRVVPFFYRYRIRFVIGEPGYPSGGRWFSDIEKGAGILTVNGFPSNESFLFYRPLLPL